MPLDRYLVEYCAPTLASLKVASLFRFCYGDESELAQAFARWNQSVKGKGIRIFILKQTCKYALVYVVRDSHLSELLKDGRIRRFLSAYGYEEFTVEGIVGRLRGRLLSEAKFPHEIGIFLGYPLGDVVGFIRNEGRNGKCVGSWMVYCNEKEACKAFERHQKCRRIYLECFLAGRSVMQLTVTG